MADQLHAELPEFTGMTAFGSTVRGEAGPDSDVDIAVFIEPSDAEGSPQRNPNVPKGDAIRVNPYARKYEFHGGIDTIYKTLILRHLQEEGVMKADMDVLPISQGIIEHSRKRLLDKAEKHEGPDTGENMPVVPKNIRFLFHAPIDDERLRPYVSQTLEGLQESPYGERAWGMIRRTVAHFEEGRDDGAYESNPHRYIPPTLADAVGFYEEAGALTRQ
ncbi:MAG: nucleotidyltransferase domain-containing protein [Proteobacteria bacterium]|nr:nucleotidyltransferase domain-containing protein [Pseudomonadota bacterium]